MILKRKIYDKLVEWKKESNGSTALLIGGARRVGKSFVAKAFGEMSIRVIFSLTLPSLRRR